MTDKQRNPFVETPTGVDHVEIEHDEVETTAVVPADAVPLYEERGWKVVERPAENAEQPQEPEQPAEPTATPTPTPKPAKPQTPQRDGGKADGEQSPQQ